MERGGKKESALQWALSHFDDHDNIPFEISFVRNACVSADSKYQSTLNDSIKKAISIFITRLLTFRIQQMEKEGFLLQAAEEPASFIPYRIFQESIQPRFPPVCLTHAV